MYKRQVYATGRSGDWPITGFSPRAQNITLYIKRLTDVDLAVLDELVATSVEHMRRTNPPADASH